MPATKYSRGRPSRLPLRRDGGLVVARRQLEQLVGHRHRRGGRVALVAAGDRVEQRRRVARVAGERPDLVERAGERDDPVAADTRPYVGFIPTMPVSAAGWRIEPPVSVPSETGAWYAATATAEPPLDPPGTVSRSHGFETGP